MGRTEKPLWLATRDIIHEMLFGNSNKKKCVYAKLSFQVLAGNGKSERTKSFSYNMPKLVEDADDKTKTWTVATGTIVKVVAGALM